LSTLDLAHKFNFGPFQSSAAPTSFETEIDLHLSFFKLTSTIIPTLWYAETISSNDPMLLNNLSH